MSAAISELHPDFAPLAQWFVEQAEQAGYQVQVTSTRRSVEQQQHLYDRFLAGLSDLPAVPPSVSFHVHGLAFDAVVDRDYHGSAQSEVGLGWKSLGGAWNPADPVHFAAPSGWAAERW